MEPQYLDNLAALNKEGRDYVRLLRVHTPSSRPKETTLCELRVFSLHGAPRDSALSYYRQPESGVVNIDVRGSVKGSFPISHDLRSAMRAVQHHRRSDWLCIDALCINQSSTGEKNDQVPRMRAIYESAHAGFIWLGAAVARTTAFKAIDGSRAEKKDDLVSCYVKDDFVIAPLKFLTPETGSKEAQNAYLGFTIEKSRSLQAFPRGIARGGAGLGSSRKWCFQLDSTCA